MNAKWQKAEDLIGRSCSWELVGPTGFVFAECWKPALVVGYRDSTRQWHSWNFLGDESRAGSRTEIRAMVVGVLREQYDRLRECFSLRWELVT